VSPAAALAMSRSCCEEFPRIFKGCQLLAAAPRDMSRDMAAPAPPPDLLAVAAQYIAPAIIGGVAGLVASVAAPWGNWRVEKAKAKFDARRKLVQTWRAMATGEDGWSIFNVVQTELALLQHPAYSTLHPRLSTFARSKLEAHGYVVAPSTYAVSITEQRELRRLLSAEIDRIEKRWGLV
jgi:hypothetical protein